MNSAISVNDVTSTITARPPGTPRRAKCADGAPVGPLDAAPDGVGAVQGLGAQQPHGAAQEQVVHQHGGPGAAHGALRLQPQPAEGEPDRQRHLDQQRQRLQPGHQQRLAQALVERAVHAKQQRRRQGQRQHGQVAPAPLPAAAAGTSVQRSSGAGKQQGPAAGQHAEHAPRYRPAAPSGRGPRGASPPCSSAQVGSKACSTPIRATKTLMYTAEPTDSAARACSE